MFKVRHTEQMKYDGNRNSNNIPPGVLELELQRSTYVMLMLECSTQKQLDLTRCFVSYATPLVIISRCVPQCYEEEEAVTSAVPVTHKSN